MAAKPLPELAQWTLQVVNPGVVNTNQAMKIGALDTVTFHNGCTFPINITFSSAISEIQNLQPGQNSLAIGASNVTVDYWIYNANTLQLTGGPYAIEFGIGPLVVVISNDSSSPDPIMIPYGGKIQFNTQDPNGYNISWSFKGSGQPANVWSPQPATIPNGSSPIMTALTGANNQTMAYALTSLTGIRGGGTVVVNS